MFINYSPVALKIFLFININLSIVLHIKLHIVHTYKILATQIIIIFYQTYNLLYYQNLKYTFTIILFLVKINKIIPGFALYQATTLQRFVADIATRHYRTSQLTPQAQKKLTPQADQEPRQYRSSRDWHSKFIRLEHEYMLLKF